MISIVVFLCLPFAAHSFGRNKGGAGLLIAWAVIAGALGMLFWYGSNHNGPSDLTLWLYIYMVACPLAGIAAIAALVGTAKHPDNLG